MKSMKKWIVFVLPLVFALALSGCGAAESREKTLTLEKVEELAGKGEDLTWGDLEGYSYEDTGSGLYVHLYDIDETYCLVMGGGSTEEPPMYVRLVRRAEGSSLLDDGEYIDIRTEDIGDFRNGQED